MPKSFIISKNVEPLLEKTPREPMEKFKNLTHLHNDNDNDNEDDDDNNNNDDDDDDDDDDVAS